ncbi:MAG: glycosyltransferase family 2 protein [Lachnospiraceae bacterium]|nr:glycosyltransferase family 2 protein [Lachnospiraceae bacterium]
MTAEKVSIVVPVYNAEKYLEETVESVRRQTYENWELLLVDDCSSDKSAEVMKRLAERDARIRPVFQPQNGGAAKARNRGIREAEGGYIAFLDADDIWKPEKLEKELAFLREKDAAFVFSGYEFADEQARGLGKIVRVPERLTYRQALKNTTIFTSTVLLDVERLGKELIQMPDIKSEDTAAWWKILRNGYTAYGLNENLVYYRRSAGTLSANKLEAVKRIWRLYRQAEGLSMWYSFYNFCFYAVRAVLRRI